MKIQGSSSNPVSIPKTEFEPHTLPAADGIVLDATPSEPKNSKGSAAIAKSILQERNLFANARAAELHAKWESTKWLSQLKQPTSVEFPNLTAKPKRGVDATKNEVSIETNE
jgi:hypothetical protein